MKTAVKKLLGDALVFQLKDLQLKYFPSQAQKQDLAKIEDQFRRRKQFYGSFLRHDDLCFDVGANMGNRISPLLAIGAKVVAVEPQESCIRYLNYKFGRRINLVTKGLDDHDGMRDFHIANISVISSFSDEWINSVKQDRFKNYRWDKTTQVEMTTLDSLIAQYGVPKFIKIDVEGFELNVLRGLSKPVDMISFEYTVPEQANRALECLDCIERTNPNIQCNYSVRETMELVLSEWQPAERMKSHIQSKDFVDTRFGDIYVKSTHGA